jgi:HK97 family phage major capsid protein
MPAMTQDELDAFVKKSVDEAIIAKSAEQEEKRKGTIRAEFQELYEKTAFDQELKGVKQDDIGTIAKMAILTGCSNGNASKMEELSKAYWPEDKMLQGMVKKGMEAGVPSSGGFTVPQVLASRVIEPLYANTMLEKIGVSKVSLPNGNQRVPRMDSSASIYWLGEAQALTQTQGTFGDILLNLKKAGAFVEMSNDLNKYSAVGMEAIVAKDLKRRFAIGLDTAWLYGSGTAYTPLGMSGIPGVQSYGSSGTTLLQTHPDDMVSLLESSNAPMTNVRWLMHPQMKAWLKSLKTATGSWLFREEIVKDNTLGNYPIICSTSVSYTDAGTDYADLWLGDFDDCLWGVGTELEMRMVRDTAFVSGGVTYSTTQRDTSLVTVLGSHDFSISRPATMVRGIFAKP